MKKYKVIHRVEIAGVTRKEDEVLPADIFADAPKLSKEQVADGLVAVSEIESLLSTGHIEEI